MKKLIVILMMLQPVLIKAQTDSVKVSFSEEKVENFQKTTLIDEYEKAFGNNRIVKTALRIGFNKGSQLSSMQGTVPLPFNTFLQALIPSLLIEQKIGLDKSIIVSFTGSKSKQNILWSANVGLEGRWYYQMKHRVKMMKQQPNITGKYISLRYNWLPYKTNPLHKETKLEWVMYQPTSSYSINWGWQFGNNVNYGFSLGVKQGDKATINSENIWVDINRSNYTSATWFFSTDAQAGFGLYFPLKKRISSNYCDFLQCNYDVKQLFKVNLNNALYLDKYSQIANLDIAYERKIEGSSVSINSTIKAIISGRSIYKQIGIKADTFFVDGMPFLKTYATYTNGETSQQWLYNVRLNEQLRYYPGMKKRIAKGESANNLNGTYIAASGQIVIQKTKNLFIDYLTLYQPGVGVSIGYQIQTNRNSFLDISANFIRQRFLIPAIRKEGNESVIDFSLKLGFAR
ncbi:hypothetical protein [Emticicia fontis]